MAFSYKIDKRRKLVLCTLSGCVSVDDVLVFREQALKDPDFNPNYSQLIDLTATAQLDLTVNQVRTLTDISPFAPGAHRAIVGGNELAFGFARVTEIVRTLRGDQHIRVFRKRADAMAWLLAKDKAA